MADIQQLEKALRNAHAAGDVNAAKRFASEIRKMQIDPAQARSELSAMLPDVRINQKKQSPSMAQTAMQTAIGFTPFGVVGNASQAVKNPWQSLQKADDAVRMLANGATFGYADKIAAKANQLIGADENRLSDLVTGSSPLEREQLKSKQAKERLGPTGDLLEIGGSMLPATKLAQMGITATRLPGLIGKFGGMAIDGAGLGALSAAGNDQDIATGAAFGAAGGAAGQMLGAGASKIAGLFNKKPVLPTLDDLASQSKSAYQQAENAGLTIKPQAMDRLRKDVYDEYANFGYHPELQPGAKVAYNEIERLAQGGNVDLKGIEGVRKISSAGFNPTNPSNNALLGKTTGKIDDFLENLGPNDVLAGDPVAASASLKEARRLWAQKSKLARVDDLLEKAGLQAGSTGSGGNIENASRQQLKKLLTNPKMTRAMTKDEIKATKNAVLGTKSQNALRLIGKLSPQGNGLMMAIQAFGAGATGGMTLPLAAAGFGAKKASEAMTKKNADLLKAIIAGGGSKAAVMPSPNKAQQLIDQNKDLIARLLMGGAIGAAQ